MATSKTKIVNRSLMRVGARPVTNIETDDTEEARIINNLYDIALENILSETLWTFAKKRALLTTTTDTVPFNVDEERLNKVYQRPTDCIRIFHVNDTAADWYEEEDKIVSDTAGLGIVYTFRNENPATYKSYFVTALSDLLASEIAYALLNSTSKSQEMLEVYERISLPKAKAQNAQTGKARGLNDDYWLNSRHGGPNVKEFG